MIVSIHQPAYLPWLGYFERIARSDVHVVLDDVQFEKNSFINRNRVRTPEGTCWLTVPVRTGGRFGALAINALETDNTADWGKKHARSLAQGYAKAAYFTGNARFFADAYERRWTHLLPLCLHITGYLLAALEIRTPLVLASTLNVSGHKDERILAICRQLGATTYLSGALGRNYLNAERFSGAGIELKYQDYEHPVYPQGRGWFERNLSVVDLLFHCGPASRDILLGAVAAGAR
jgi:hypothetical protein